MEQKPNWRESQTWEQIVSFRSGTGAKYETYTLLKDKKGRLIYSYRYTNDNRFDEDENETKFFEGTAEDFIKQHEGKERV